MAGPRVVAQVYKLVFQFILLSQLKENMRGEILMLCLMCSVATRAMICQKWVSPFEGWFKNAMQDPNFWPSSTFTVRTTPKPVDLDENEEGCLRQLPEREGWTRVHTHSYANVILLHLVRLCSFAM